MSTIEEFEAAPVGAIARSHYQTFVRTNLETTPWVGEVRYPGGVRSMERVSADYLAEQGFTLDPTLAVPSTAREALDLAWDLAHPVKEGQVIPANTETILISDASLHMTSEGWDQVVEPGLVGILRTLDPIPAPDWLDAPAVLARVDGWSSCADPQVFARHDYHDAPSEWRYNGSESYPWQELRDVTPLYPKEDA